MSGCFECGTEDTLGFTCSYCNEQFCSKHRLPENHDCPFVMDASTLGPEFRRGRNPAGITSRAGRKSSLRTCFRYWWMRTRSALATLDRLISTVVSIAVVAVLLWAVIAILLSPPVDVDGRIDFAPNVSFGQDRSINETETELLIHEAVNEERSQLIADRLEYDHELAAVADGYSSEMASQSFLSHTAPDGDTLDDRYQQHDYECSFQHGDSYYYGGENLAQTHVFESLHAENGSTVVYDDEESLARGVVELWMNSPEHRENMLHTAWRRQGIGVEITDDGTVYVTQNFC